MPENTPMKMQWITVDGRQTPIVLPQIWNHEKQDWEVTSEENRLPVDARLTGSNMEDGIVTRPREVETFTDNDIKVSAGSFLQYTHFNARLKHGYLTDMRQYSHFYFGAQSFLAGHEFYLLVRQKPFGTGGSIIQDIESDRGTSTKLIGKTTIDLHNLSLRVYNESEEEQTYQLAAGFWLI